MRSPSSSFRVTWSLLVASAAAIGAQSPAAAREVFLPSVGLRGKAFVDKLTAGEFPQAARGFDATMARALPAASLEAAWRDLERKMGPFQRISNVRVEEVAGHRLVFVSCAFARGAIDTKVVFSRAGKVTGLWFAPPRVAFKWSPPAYARRGAFDEREVTFGDRPWRLPGTLSLPKRGRALAGVVLVHGSGPNNRDQEVGGVRVFKDLAWGLASQGIAVLRYDKRSLKHGRKLAALGAKLTVNEETVDDAVAAAALLRQQARIARQRVFVAGHSLGGMLAPRIAQHAARRNVALAGLIILAGNTRPIPDLIVEQVSYLAQLDGTVDANEKKEIDAARAFRQAASSGQLKPTATLELFGTTTWGRYWIDLRDYDPARAAAGLALPMFIAQGARDYQVTVKDFDGWKRALGGREDVAFHLYPKLNHLLVAGQGKSTPAEYQRAGTVSGPLVADLVTWIRKR